MHLARLVVLVGLLGLVPSATAQDPALTVSLALADGADPQEAAVIPESRRLNIPLAVSVTAQGFVCAAAVPVTVQVVLNAYPDHWAGASVNPDDVHFQIPQGAPGTAAASYSTDEQPLLELAWDEDRPSQGAQETYVLETSTTWEPTCAPTGVTVHEGLLNVSARMEDRPVETATSASCDMACPTSSSTPANPTPGPGFAAALAGAAAIVLARHRR